MKTIPLFVLIWYYGKRVKVKLFCTEMAGFLVRVLVIREERCNEEKFAETICRIRAVIGAVVRAEFRAEKMAAMQKSFAETSCRNELQKPCRLWHREVGQKKMAAMQMHVQKKCRKGDTGCTHLVQN
jgi:hypothetical protein